MNDSLLPNKPGAYALHLSLRSAVKLEVGKLGNFYLQPGDYWYMGSAHGPGGLSARLGRHLAGNGRPHWHIDALRSVTEVESFFLIVEEETKQQTPLECTWSQKLASLPEVEIPIRRFGSSDCGSGCPAHLVWIRTQLSDYQIAKMLGF